MPEKNEKKTAGVRGVCPVGGFVELWREEFVESMTRFLFKLVGDMSGSPVR